MNLSLIRSRLPAGAEKIHFMPSSYPSSSRVRIQNTLRGLKEKKKTFKSHSVCLLFLIKLFPVSRFYCVCHKSCGTAIILRIIEFSLDTNSTMISVFPSTLHVDSASRCKIREELGTFQVKTIFGVDIHITTKTHDVDDSGGCPQLKRKKFGLKPHHES